MNNPSKRFRSDRLSQPALLGMPPVARKISSISAPHTSRSMVPDTRTGEDESKTDWYIHGPSTLVICLSIHNFTSHSKEKMSVFSSMVKCEKIVGSGRNPEQYTWVLSVTPSSRVKLDENAPISDDFIGVNLIRRDGTPGQVPVKFKFSIRSGVAEESAALYEQPPINYKFNPDGGCYPIHNFIPHNDLARRCEQHGLVFTPASSLVIRVQLDFQDIKIIPPRAIRPVLSGPPVPVMASRASSDCGPESSSEHFDEHFVHKSSTSAPTSPAGDYRGHGGFNSFGRRLSESSNPSEDAISAVKTNETLRAVSDRISTEQPQVLEHHATSASPPKTKLPTPAVDDHLDSCVQENVRDFLLEIPEPSKALLIDLNRLYKNPLSSDFTIVSNDDGHFRGHRGVLQIRSKRFHDIITADPNLKKYRIVEFDSVVVDSLLQFLYTGTADTQDAHIGSLLAAGHAFGVSDLVTFCQARLNNVVVTLDNAIAVLMAAEQMEYKALYLRTMDFLRANIRSLSGAVIGQLHDYKADLLQELYNPRISAA